ncbi:Myblike DNAbinding domain-containing protein [Gryganskiella cystojenkinii]|nr:Myblike DNAbinding domain-containing protein [Gryganskiella cystojenkinii]
MAGPPSNAMDLDEPADSDHAARLTEDMDMDDLLSDESDNDDLVENEDELQALLAREHISIDHTAFTPPPPPDRAIAPAHVAQNSNSSIAMPPTASSSSSVSTSSAIPSNTTTFDAIEWLIRIQRQHEQEHGLASTFSSSSIPTGAFPGTFPGTQLSLGHEANQNGNQVQNSYISHLIPIPATSLPATSLPATNLPATSIPTLPTTTSTQSNNENDLQQQQSSHEDEQLQEYEAEPSFFGDDEDGQQPQPQRPRVHFRSSSWRQQQKRSRKQKPAGYGQYPITVSEDENRNLTAEIRKQTEHALEVNRSYQEVLKKHLKEIEDARQRNIKQRAVIQDLVERQERVKKAPIQLEGTNQRIGPPYFVDQFEQVPPDNADSRRIKEKPLVVTGDFRTWTYKEREQLLIGVISENKRLLFEKYSQEGDMRAIRALDTAPDTEMAMNTVGLDWGRISRLFVDTRSATECLIQWTGLEHPGINKKEWTSAELTQLEKLVEKYNGRNWIQIALELNTNRTAAQCFRKYNSRLNKAFSNEIWTKEEDSVLLEAVRLIGDKDWKKISYCFDNRSAAQCRHHWNKTVNPAIRRGKWVEEEDEALRAATTLFGGKGWGKIQEFVLGRTDRQCRERYCDRLDPALKSGPWDPEEIERLRKLVQEHGSRWAKIASLLPGRTDNQACRRWRLLVREDEKKAREATGQTEVGEGGTRRVKKPRSSQYLGYNRRKGFGTIAATPDIKRHREEIRRLARLIQAQDQRDRQKKGLVDAYQKQLRGLQSQEIQRYYDDATERQREIYDVWQEQSHGILDPIEKVFNLGIPPPTPVKSSKRRRDGFEHDDELEQQDDEDEDGGAAVEGEQEETEEELKKKLKLEEDENMKLLEAAYENVQDVIKPKVPNPAAVVAPGLIRPVPPCVATMEAFSNLLDQGELNGGRFRMKTVSDNAGHVVVQPLPVEILSAEEQGRPEYRELADRFEATFLWPMLMGMLNQETGHALVKSKVSHYDRVKRKQEKELRELEAALAKNTQITLSSSSSSLAPTLAGAGSSSTSGPPSNPE